MRKTTLFIFLLISFFLLSESPVDATRGISIISDLSHQSGKLGAYRALIIGINDYNDPKIPDLKTAVNDAKAMTKLLQERYGFKVKLLLNDKATRRAIYKALRNIALTAEPKDSVLIYYAGHGDLDRTYDDGWWIPVDAKGGDPVTYLDNVQVQKSMRGMKARHVLLISDSCYSGTLFGQARAMPPVIDDKYYLNLYNERSRWGMTSGNKTPVSDQGSGGHSVFAYQLLKELKKNEKPYISTQEIYTRIAPIIGNNSEQTPLCRPIRNAGDQGGEFVFVASRGLGVEKPSSVSTQAFLSVESNVSGARVFVDGKYVGTTPLSKEPLSAVEHRVLVERSGYESYQRRIRFEKGRSESLYVDLGQTVPLKGRLYVDTQPANARVRILNISPSFYQGIELDQGKYHVEVSSADHETKKQWVSLAAGEDKTLDIRLKPVVFPPAPVEHTTPERAETNKFASKPNNFLYEITHIRFFEGGKKAPEASDRVYKEFFDKEVTRYVYTELKINNLQYKAEPHSHEVLWFYYNPNGSLRGRIEGTFNVKSEWATAWIYRGWGWENPGNWPFGTYKVKLFIDGVNSGEKYFTIR